MLAQKHHPRKSIRCGISMAFSAIMVVSVAIHGTPASAQVSDRNTNGNQRQFNDRISNEIRNFLSSFRKVGSQIILTFIPGNGPFSGRFAIDGQGADSNVYPFNRCTPTQPDHAEICDVGGGNVAPSPSPAGSPTGNPDGDNDSPGEE